MIDRGFGCALALLLGALAGCGAQMNAAGAQKVSGMIMGGVSTGREVPGSTPVQLDDGAGILMVARENSGQSAGLGLLSRSGGGVQAWSTQDGIALTLRNGMLIGTAGFGPDLFSVDVDPILARASGQAATRIHRYVDGENHVQVMAFTCVVSIGGGERVEATGGTVYREACTGRDSQFENRFVFSNSGRLLASRQWAGPALGHFALRMPGAAQ